MMMILTRMAACNGALLKKIRHYKYVVVACSGTAVRVQRLPVSLSERYPYNKLTALGGWPCVVACFVVPTNVFRVILKFYFFLCYLFFERKSRSGRFLWVFQRARLLLGGGETTDVVESVGGIVASWALQVTRLAVFGRTR